MLLYEKIHDTTVFVKANIVTGFEIDDLNSVVMYTNDGGKMPLGRFYTYESALEFVTKLDALMSFSNKPIDIEAIRSRILDGQINCSECV